MTEARFRVGLAAAALLAATGALAGCTQTPSCGDLAVDVNACAGPVQTGPTGALPTFADGVGMSEWLMYRGNDVRALSYIADARQVSVTNARIDVLQVEECAPQDHPATISHDRWALADSSGDSISTVAGKLVDGRLTEDPPLTLAAGDCAKTALALAVPVDAKPATAHDGPVATWVLPSD